MTNANPTVPPFVNVIVKALLRSPLHGAMSHNTMLLSFAGRKTGKLYSFPVSYARDGDTVTCYTDSGWWKNMRGGAPVTLWVKGRELHGIAVAEADDKTLIAESLRNHLKQTPRDAKYHGVKLDAEGTPDAEDLERAAQTSVLVRIRIAEETASA